MVKNIFIIFFSILHRLWQIQKKWKEYSLAILQIFQIFLTLKDCEKKTETSDRYHPY